MFLERVPDCKRDTDARNSNEIVPTGMAYTLQGIHLGKTDRFECVQVCESDQTCLRINANSSPPIAMLE